MANMDGDSTVSRHVKTIIHIDIDYFYAQVELLRHPHLENEPVGVKQKNLLVTCNYVARRFGVKKCMSINEALKICPNLFLFNGENLYKYRQASNQIHLFLSSFTTKVEKCGFDENYLDVSDLVSEREANGEHVAEDIVGHCMGDVRITCFCGCHRRLSIGSQIAHEIRTKLKNELGFSSSCGISYNKLLAKISSSVHKPDQQTTLLPNGTSSFMLGLKDVEAIPGIGEKTKQLLESLNIRTVKDLREADPKTLKGVFGSEKAVVGLKNLSRGICHAAVKPTEKPLSIGLEDGSRRLSVDADVREKFGILLKRLMILVEEDGRIPTTVKVTVRQQDQDAKVGNKETKQSPVSPSLFPPPGAKLSEASAARLLDVIMSLFRKIVDVSRPFRVTLLGLAFSKFQEKHSDRSVASFLLRKRDLSVQSLTSFVSTDTKSRLEVSEPVVPDCSKSDSDSETEPSPKKKKLDLFLGKRKFDGPDVDAFSPSKLDVKNLNLNGDGDVQVECPAHVDPTVFRELPPDLQNEIVRDWKVTLLASKSSRSKQTLIHNYCIPKNAI